MAQPYLSDLYHHLHWADALMWAAITTSDTAQADPALLDTVFHIHETQNAFLDVWLEHPFQRRKRTDFANTHDLMRWARTFHDSATPFVQKATQDALDHPCLLPWAKYFARSLGHEPHQSTLRETIQQVHSHSMHHRGQVSRRLRELDLTPPTMDYIVWVWAGRPEPSWPA